MKIKPATADDYEIGTFVSGNFNRVHNCKLEDDGKLFLIVDANGDEVERYSIEDSFLQVSVERDGVSNTFVAFVEPIQPNQVPQDRSTISFPSDAHNLKVAFEPNNNVNKVAFIGNGDVRPNKAETQISILSDAVVILNWADDRFNILIPFE